MPLVYFCAFGDSQATAARPQGNAVNRAPYAASREGHTPRGQLEGRRVIRPSDPCCTTHTTCPNHWPLGSRYASCSDGPSFP